MTLVRRRPSARCRRSSASTTSTRRSRSRNGTAYGLSSAVCTNRLDYITRFVAELQVGTVNVREVPGYRLELTPFGGIKDSGLGYKEGVQEAMKSFTNIKTYSLPWAEEANPKMQTLLNLLAASPCSCGARTSCAPACCACSARTCAACCARASPTASPRSWPASA